MAQTDHYARCSKDARTAPVGQFTPRWPGHYLLVTIPGSDSDDWDMDFHTSILSADTVSAAPGSPLQPAGDEDEAEAPPGTYLFEIKKHADNTWLEWIAVGRAHNNDLILRHQSVSKLHARLHVQGDGATGPSDRGGFWLTDMKSTAGTTINGAYLPPSKPIPLSPGDVIRLGMVTCEFLDSVALHRRLAAADW
jgi:hypothetical protein